MAYSIGESLITKLSKYAFVALHMHRKELEKLSAIFHWASTILGSRLYFLNIVKMQIAAFAGAVILCEREADIQGWLRLMRHVWALALNLSVCADLTDSCSGSVGSFRSCADLCGQKWSSKPDQGRGFESRLCHTELTSSKNGVGQHWWGTCHDYMPQWLGETCCVRGMSREYVQPLPHFLKQKIL